MNYYNANPKPGKKKKNKKRPEDEDYLNFIRSQPCMICGRQSEPHHEPLNGHGMGYKGSDRETLPLCRCHHTTGLINRHTTGRKTFYEYYGIDWRKEVVRYQERYDRTFNRE